MGLIPANKATEAVLQGGGGQVPAFLKKKILKGKNIKYLSFKGLTASTLFVFDPRVSKGRGFQEESSRDQALQTEANTFLVSSPVAASNMLGFEVRFPLQRRLSALPGNRATRRDLEIMSFPRGRRCCSGSPENILSDWLVFYSPLSRPGVCC